MSKLVQFERGFSTLEAMLILVIVGLIGFIGWYVYQSKNNTTSTYNAVQASSTITSNGQNSAFFDLKELGVKFISPSSLAGLHYTTIKPTGDLLAGAFLEDKATDTVFKQCLADKVDQNFTLTADEQSFISINKVKGTPPSASAVVGPQNNFVKQFNGFYISVGYPNGITCPGNQADITNWMQALKLAQQALLPALTKTTVQD